MASYVIITLDTTVVTPDPPPRRRPRPAISQGGGSKIFSKTLRITGS